NRGLSEAHARTYAVLEAQFGAAAEAARFPYGDFSPLGGLRPYVLNQLDSAFISLPSFLEERHTIANPQDGEAYIMRLEAVAEAIDAETARARADAERGVRAPIYIIDTVIGMLDQAASVRPTEQIYFTSFRRKLDALSA